MAAWRAGACPAPPCTTCPMITSSMSFASTPARLTASRMAIAPSLGAVNDASAPRNLPIGVRVAETMTAVRDASMLYPLGRERPTGDLGLQQRHKRVLRHDVLFLAGPADANRDSPGIRLTLADHREVRDFGHFAVAHLVVERLGALVEVRADAGGPQRAMQGARRIELPVGDGQHAHLFGRKPQRERTREVLDEDREEALERAADGAVNDDGPVLGVVLAHVQQVEPVGRGVIELDRAQLPGPADRVGDGEVDLGPEIG